MRAPSDRFQSLQVDLNDFAQVRRALASITSVQAIVHAAGLMHTARLGSLNESDGARMWAVHVGAAEVLMNELANRMNAGGRMCSSRVGAPPG